MKLGHMLKRISTLIITVWLILLALFLIIPGNSNAFTVLPIATISLDQSSQTADVSPGSLGLVEFTGTVTCECMTGTTAIVSLSASDTWGSATITPSAIQFSANDKGPKNFSVAVKAPLGTSSNTVGQVVVTGRVVMYPSSLYGTVQPRDGVVGRIDIAPYYKFSTYTNNPEIQCQQGAQTECCFYIDNLGNAEDTFQISTTNDDQLFNSGLQVTVDTPEVMINEQETEDIFVSIITSESAGIYSEYNLQLEVASFGYEQETGAPLKECLNLNLQIVEKEEYFDFDIPIEDLPDLIETGELDVEKKDEPKESDSLFTPGFESVSVIICVLILILLLRKSDNHCRK
jgi:hypothetical protein